MLTAMLISAALILLTLTVHYLVLREVSVKLIQWGCPCYRGLTLAVVSITLAHIFEAGAFAVGFWFADTISHIGTFDTDQPMSSMDYFYFSLVNFTTLGRGDITPLGHLRFISGIEAFVGFLMITASGSYVLQVMSGNPPRVGVKNRS